MPTSWGTVLSVAELKQAVLSSYFIVTEGFLCTKMLRFFSMLKEGQKPEAKCSRTVPTLSFFFN